ncbi:preprotein translocase subunit SecA [Endothiovibrio diazotrophicus]
MNLFDLSNRIARLIGERTVQTRTRSVDKQTAMLRSISDFDLRSRCGAALAGEGEPRFGASNAWDRLLSFLRGLSFLGESLDTRTTENLALGIEAFRRVPADLPAGSFLYREQVRAAVSLCGQVLIQMDTGEGKTYALLPAAFALACKHHQVYIVCANKYLAWRDAGRTRNYWNYVGLSVGLALTTDSEEWSHRVVYTTLEQLMFRALNDGAEYITPSYPISFTAAILDEVDSILLDQSSNNYNITVSLKTEAFDWSDSSILAKNLVPEDDIKVDLLSLTACLTPLGEEKLKQSLSQRKADSSRYLLIRQAVERMFIATRIVQEDRDYVIHERTVVPISRITGQLEFSSTLDWVVALEQHLGFDPRGEAVSIHSMNPKQLLSRFCHISGVSGTLDTDALEYFVDYRLPTLVIPPRRQRVDGLKEDLVYLTFPEAVSATINEALTAAKDGRPVLIGTQEIAHATHVHNILSSQLPSDKRLFLVSGKNDSDIAEVFKTAGETDVVVVATQLAGRGVDIRLSESARQSGGMHLVCLGHAFEPRYDRQFLGRAGRQGDPYTAIFISSLEDRVVKIFASDRVSQFMQTLGIKENEAISHPWVTKSIKHAQDKIHFYNFSYRQHRSLLSYVEEQINPQIGEWMEFVQLRGKTSEDTLGDLEYGLSRSFIQWLVLRYIDKELKTLLDAYSEVRAKDGIQVARILSDTIGISYEDARHASLEIEGRTPKTAHSVLSEWITERLTSVLNRASKQYCVWLKAFVRAKKTHDRLLEDVEQLAEQIHGLDGPTTKQLASQIRTHIEKLKSDPSDSDSVLAIQNTLSSILVELRQIIRSRNCFDDILFTSLLITLGSAMANVMERIDSGCFCRYLLRLSRRPRDIAHWCIFLPWSEFIEERARIIHRVKQQEDSAMEQYRMITDRILNAWDKVESALPAFTIRHLLLAESAERLNYLFIYEDFSITTETKPKSNFEWDASHLNLSSAERSSARTINSLISEFGGHSNIHTEESFGPDSLVHLLTRFLNEAPLHTLQTPDRIYTAIGRWRDLERAEGVAESRQKINHRWIRLFLLFLRERQLVGPLPVWRTRALAFAKNIKNAILERRTGLALLSSGIFLAAFMLLTYYGPTGRPVHTDGWLIMVDLLAFGGLLDIAPVTAATFSSMVAMFVISHLIFRNRFHIDSLYITGYSFILIPQIAISLLVTPWAWSGGNFFSISGQILFFASAIIVSRIGQSIAFNVENYSGLSLMAVWLAYCFLLQGTPYMISQNVSELQGWIVFGVLFSAFVAWAWINRKEVVLVSARTNTNSSVKSENIETATYIAGATGVEPHIYSLLVAGSTHAAMESISPGMDSHGIWSAITYALVLFYGATALIGRRLFSSLWLKRLSERRQIIKGMDTQQDTVQHLKFIEKTLVMRECGMFLFSLLAVLYIFRGQTESATGMHLGIFALFLAAASSSWVMLVSQQLYRMLVNRAPIRHQLLEVSDIPIVNDDQTKLEIAVDWLKRNVYSLLVAVFMIIQTIRILGQISDFVIHQLTH